MGNFEGMSMNVSEIQLLSRASGTAVVPSRDDYDGASDDWTETEYRADTPGEHLVGHWTGAPGWVRIDVWPYTEVCVIRSGAVEIEDDRGATRRFGAGEAFVIPQGFAGIWRTLEPTEKVFVGIAS